jgi:hypothetical protein
MQAFDYNGRIMGIGRSIKSLLGGSNAIARHEHVVFFPTAAEWREGGAGKWHVPVHGWIFRPAELSRLRRFDLWLLRRTLRGKLALDEAARAFFKQRAGSFLADNERWRRLSIRIGELVVRLGRSRASGHFRGKVELTREAVAGAEVVASAVSAERRVRWVRFGAEVEAHETRAFAGRVMLLPAEGVSVISDIDDTVKVTEVGQRRKMLANTFLREFAPVPGMAEVYRRWERELGAAFHYVSGSPWHLYPFLEEFLRKAGFPAGTFHLRQFRLMPRGIRQSVRPAGRVKLKHARELMERFPRRRFILVGDSGESDAAMYARLYGEYPGRVERILIRDVTQGRARARLSKAFRDVPRENWRVFSKVEEIAE